MVCDVRVTKDVPIVVAYFIRYVDGAQLLFYVAGLKDVPLALNAFVLLLLPVADEVGHPLRHGRPFYHGVGESQVCMLYVRKLYLVVCIHFGPQVPFAEHQFVVPPAFCELYF